MTDLQFFKGMVIMIVSAFAAAGYIGAHLTEERKPEIIYIHDTIVETFYMPKPYGECYNGQFYANAGEK